MNDNDKESLKAYTDSTTKNIIGIVEYTTKTRDLFNSQNDKVSRLEAEVLELKMAVSELTSVISGVRATIYQLNK